MARDREPYKVKPEAIYETIARSDQPALTVGEIADRLDVSEPTIRDHIDKILNWPGVRTKKIGRATVYWYDTNDLDEANDASLDFSTQTLLKIKAEKRARWLLHKQQIQHFVAEGEDSPRLRAWAWEKLEDYLGTVALQSRQELSELSHNGEWEMNHENAFVKPDPEDITNDEIERHILDVHFFTSSWFGEVRGYKGLRDFETQRKRRLKEAAEEHGLSDPELSEYPTQELDEIHPSIPDILAAGETYDRLVCKMLGFEW